MIQRDKSTRNNRKMMKMKNTLLKKQCHKRVLNSIKITRSRMIHSWLTWIRGIMKDCKVRFKGFLINVNINMLVHIVSLSHFNYMVETQFTLDSKSMDRMYFRMEHQAQFMKMALILMKLFHILWY